MPALQPPPAVERVLTDAQNGQVVAVRPGEAVRVRLGDRGPLGMGWTPVRPTPGLQVSYRGFQSDWPAARGREIMDAPGAEVFDVRVLVAAPRTTTLRFRYQLSATQSDESRTWRVKLRVQASAPRAAGGVKRS